MPVVIGNGSTAKIVLYAVLASDHISKATGKTIAIKISKDGAAFGDPSGGATNATEIGSGWYYFSPSSTDTGTNGPLIVLGTEASIDDSTRDFLVETASSVPTTAQIATAVWEDLTAGGDFGTTGSIGKLLVTDIDATISSRLATSGYTVPPTTAAIATAVWTDTTAGDFTTLTSPGKIIFAQLGGAFTTTSSSVFTTAALANAPTGGTAPTAAQVATAVWQDTTAGDFTVSGSIGKSLFTGGVVPGGTGGLFIAGTNAATTVTTAFTTTFTGNLTGNVGGNVVGTIGGFTTPALAQFFTTDTGKIYADAVAGSVVKEIAVGGGSDPWATPVPGSYLAGTAGYILGNRLDVSVSSRSTYSGTDTPGTTTLLSRISGPITINGGAVAIDWAHVLNPTSTVNLSNTTISPTQTIATVSGNVTGTIGGFTVPALAQFFTTNTTKVYTDAVTGSVVKEIASNSTGTGGGGLTAADVWSYATRTLTSLGATAPAGWINAASIVDHALDGKGDWSTYAGGDTPGTTTLLNRIGGAITIVSGGVNVNLTQTLSSARTLDTVADTSLTLNDAMHCAVSTTAGRAVEDKVALTYQRQTPFTGTVLRTFTIDSASAPTRRT